jgi:fatty acid desaturase
VQVWTLDAPASTAAPAEGAPAAETATQRTELQDERSSRRNAAAMLWLKAALVLLLAAAVAISGSLSYTLGACAHARARRRGGRI